MNTQDVCCAHTRVDYVRINHDGGTCSDSWKCRDCGKAFWPHTTTQDPVSRESLLKKVDAYAERYKQAGITLEALRDVCHLIAEEPGISQDGKIEMQPFTVHIPNGTTNPINVDIQIPCRWDAEIAEWIVTKEGHDLIDLTKLKHVHKLQPPTTKGSEG